MKKVMVEINGKKHGPLEVLGTFWKYVVFEQTNVGLRELGNMGAIVLEVKESKLRRLLRGIL